LFAPQSPLSPPYSSPPAEYSIYAPPPEYPPPEYPQAPPPYPQGGYTTPAMPVLGSGQNNTMGLLSMIFGILSIPLLFCCYIGIPLAIAGIILGIIGIGKANSGQASNKGMAVAGVVCSAATFVLLVGVVALAGLSAAIPTSSTSY
jgi:hypothetical protein